jgi:ATP-dependent Clp protease ATP-binding subunit ClpA
MERAWLEAQRSNRALIEPEHLLLALTREAPGITVALERHGVDVDRLRAALESASDGERAGDGGS